MIWLSETEPLSVECANYLPTQALFLEAGSSGELPMAMPFSITDNCVESPSVYKFLKQKQRITNRSIKQNGVGERTGIQVRIINPHMITAAI